MMELPVIALHLHPEIAVACGAAAAAAFALISLAAVSLAHRRLRRRCAALETSLGSVREELARVAAGIAEAAADGARELQRIEQSHARLVDRLRFVERRSDGRSFDLAIGSARSGTDAARIAADFGLSRGEAELVARMHGRPRSA